MGSSRSDGHTFKLCDFLTKQYPIDLIDLKNIDFSYYDYNHNNKDDDFIPTFRKVLNYETILFASPVYWYSMSGIMKVFLDRFTDILTIKKDLGRRLRGKSMAVLSCSGNDEPSPAFYPPFKLSAQYLGLQYKGSVHAYLEQEQITKKIKNRLHQFYESLT